MAFICDICGAGLKRKEHLERHKLGHNPERPYICSKTSVPVIHTSVDPSVHEEIVVDIVEEDLEKFSSQWLLRNEESEKNRFLFSPPRPNQQLRWSDIEERDPRGEICR
ncbi:hypothetical protein J6590_076509 [Homalodisca vitripennis]|nr:hypothetical protein J6590_076509 [Homalodisca vitripennis]